MTAFLRSLLVLGLTSFLVVACGQKEEAPAEAAPAAEAAAPAPAEAAPAATEAGGYEPTAEERVPGITLDPSQIETAPAEAAAK
jgi:hypothetical protein